MNIALHAPETAVRALIMRRLAPSRIGFRVGAVDRVDGNRYLAEIVDPNGLVVLHVEIDAENGRIGRVA